MTVLPRFARFGEVLEEERGLALNGLRAGAVSSAGIAMLAGDPLAFPRAEFVLEDLEQAGLVERACPPFDGCGPLDVWHLSPTGNVAGPLLALARERTINAPTQKAARAVRQHPRARHEDTGGPHAQ